MNPLFKSLGGNQMPGNMNAIVQQFQQFRNAFSGDPRQQVQQLLNSGRVSQAQFDRAAQLANQLQNFLK